MYDIEHFISEGNSFMVYSEWYLYGIYWPEWDLNHDH